MPGFCIFYRTFLLPLKIMEHCRFEIKISDKNVLSINCAGNIELTVKIALGTGVRLEVI